MNRTLANPRPARRPQVLNKKTGHAEVVQVEYDPAVLSYKDVLQVRDAAEESGRVGSDRKPASHLH